MSRAIVKLRDGTVINIRADFICRRDTQIEVWNGENNLVAIVKEEEVAYCYLSEQKC